VSSIRLFILGSLAQQPMHGHQLRLLAEREHVDLWTDFAVGAIYGAIKRLAADQLIEEIRLERAGNYPERQVYGITPAGRTALAEICQAGLDTVVFRPDPFDLAMARLDPARLEGLESTLQARLDTLRRKLHDNESHFTEIAKYLSVAECAVMQHTLTRLRAEIDWHQHVLQQLPDIVADERKKKNAEHA
jgi:DNA-binding PadR family transcriptional regulator